MQGRLLGFLQLYAPLGNARITVPNQYKAWRRGRMKAVVGVRFLAMSWVDATWTLCAILRVQLQGFFLFNVQHIGYRQQCIPHTPQTYPPRTPRRTVRSTDNVSACSLDRSAQGLGIPATHPMNALRPEIA
ncbi:hypothetical protein FB107DRAFT_256512 [Schizophyllum commune]